MQLWLCNFFNRWFMRRWWQRFYLRAFLSRWFLFCFRLFVCKISKIINTIKSNITRETCNISTQVSTISRTPTSWGCARMPFTRCGWFTTRAVSTWTRRTSTGSQPRPKRGISFWRTSDLWTASSDISGLKIRIIDSFLLLIILDILLRFVVSTYCIIIYLLINYLLLRVKIDD